MVRASNRSEAIALALDLAEQRNLLGLVAGPRRFDARDMGVDLGQAHQRNRGPQDDARRTANRYLKRIHYGNRTPLLDNTGMVLRLPIEAS